jgi:CHASE3 domain sensor protein
MSEQEIIERLDRIAVATEKAAARLWWIALPIYLSVLVLIFWVAAAIFAFLPR